MSSKLELEQRQLLQELIRDNENRKEVLAQKLSILYSNGFNKMLLSKMSTFFYMMKGFTIKESLILSRKKEHLTIEEINNLQYDDQTQTLQLKYDNPIQQQQTNTYYIIFIGPKNVGKTTFIFNLINSIYEIQQDSLYRVTPNRNDPNQNYYEEYYVKINSNTQYVFVDFQGIGEIQLDFFGLNNNIGKPQNIYLALLQYFQQHHQNILSIIFVNSSSVNRLGEAQKYYLQRFFELIPQPFIREQNNNLQIKLILILTYCTDNKPLLSIYESNDIIPNELRGIMQNQDQVNNQFWFGINNSHLYQKFFTLSQSAQNFDQQQINEQQRINEQQQIINKNEQIELNMMLLKNILQNYAGNQNECIQNVDVEKDEGEELNDSQIKGISKEESEVDATDSDYIQIEFQNMIKVVQQVLNKIQEKINYNHNDNHNIILNHYNALYKIENNILNAVKYCSKLGFHSQYQQPILQAYFIDCRKINQNNKEKPVRKGTYNLYCSKCQESCHTVCKYNIEMQRENLLDLINNHQTCRKLHVVQNIIECKKCRKNNPNSQCTIKDHLSINIYMEKSILVSTVKRNLQQQFINQYKENRKNKELLRLNQSNTFHYNQEYQKIIQELIQDCQTINQPNSGLIQLDFQHRQKFLKSYLEQIQNNQNLENEEENEANKKKYLENIMKIYNIIIQNQNQDQNRVQNQREDQNQNQNQRQNQNQDQNQRQHQSQREHQNQHQNQHQHQHQNQHQDQDQNDSHESPKQNKKKEQIEIYKSQLFEPILEEGQGLLKK